MHPIMHWDKQRTATLPTQHPWKRSSCEKKRSLSSSTNANGVSGYVEQITADRISRISRRRPCLI